MKRLFSLTALTMCIVMMLSLIPVCASAVEFTGDDRIVIVLDPGHDTQGEPNEYNYSEGAFNMRTAKYMKAELEKNSSFEVYLTNERNNVNLSFYERVRVADALNADVLISVHYNASESNPDLRGMEVWGSVIPKYAMDELGRMCIDYTTAAVPGVWDRGLNHRKDNSGFFWDSEHQWDVQLATPVKGPDGEVEVPVAEGSVDTDLPLSDYYSIITWGVKFGIPTFILEELYLTNADDLALATDANIKAIAEAQAHAIIDYYTGHEHTYGDVQTDIPLSCITAGKQSRHCTQCGHRKDVTTIAAAPDQTKHFYRAVDENDPDGEWFCVYTDSLINKAKIQHVHHTGDSISAAMEPSSDPTPVQPLVSTAPGSVGAISSSDESITLYTPDGPAAEDGHVHNYKVSGGQEGDFAVFTCTVEGCGHKQRVNFIATHRCSEYGCIMMAYNLVPGCEYLCAEDVPMGCATDRREKAFCLVCENETFLVTKAYDHQYSVIENGEVPAECGKAGSITSICSICAQTKVETLAPLEHDFETIENIEANCKQEGKKVERCKLCGAEETVIEGISPSHSYTSETDTSKGETVYTCTVCGDTYTEQAEKKSAFDFGENGLPLPIIAFIFAVCLMVVALIIVFILRARRAEPEEIVLDAMDFMTEEVAVEGLKSEDADEVVADLIPEIAVAVETDEKEDFSLDDIEIPVTVEEQADEAHREEALEALKQSFSKEKEE